MDGNVLLIEIDIFGCVFIPCWYIVLWIAQVFALFVHDHKVVDRLLLHYYVLFTWKHTHYVGRMQLFVLLPVEYNFLW